MASSYTATDARAYEHLMGRWSTRLAKELIAFGGLETGDRVLDVGCGTGSTVLALAARPEPMQIVGIDIAEPYIAFAATRSTDPRLSFLTGDAVALDLPVGSFDRCFSVLALNFMSDPARALARMRRVARSSGVVAAAVWDFAGALVYQRIFWDTAAALDPDAELARGRQFSSPLTREGKLAAAFEVAGLHDVEPASLTIRMESSDFSDYLGTDCKCPGTGWRLCEAASTGPARNPRGGRATGLSCGQARWASLDGGVRMGGARRGPMIVFKRRSINEAQRTQSNQRESRRGSQGRHDRACTHRHRQRRGYHLVNHQ